MTEKTIKKATQRVITRIDLCIGKIQRKLCGYEHCATLGLHTNRRFALAPHNVRTGARPPPYPEGIERSDKAIRSLSDDQLAIGLKMVTNTSRREASWNKRE
jgi:hypothetical protein